VVVKARDEETRLVAYWVGAATRDAVAAQVRARLPSHMHPAFFVRLDALPLNTNGKLDRKQLPEPAEEAIVESEAELTEDAQTQMAALFSEALERASVPADVDFFELGGDSLQLIRLRRRVKDTFGVELSLETLFDMPTVRRLAAALGPQQESRPVFVRLRSGQSDQAPLVCILGVAIYHSLAQSISDNRVVYGLHVPVDATAHEATTVESMARAYVHAIQAQLPNGPLHLTGLCFGGVVAYEVARQLRAQQRDVRTVSVLDAILRRGVHRSPAQLVKRAFAVAREDPRQAAARISERAAVHLRARFLPAAENAGAAADGARNELGLEVENEIVDAYTQTPPKIDRPLAAFRALQSEHAAWLQIDDDLGWRDMASTLEVMSVRGDHLTFLRRPLVADLARALSAFMDRYERDA
jgi:thioesterase domain-containing protein/acyl carrier protein